MSAFVEEKQQCRRLDPSPQPPNPRVSAFVEKKQQCRRLQSEGAELAKQLETAQRQNRDLEGRLLASEAACSALEAAVKEARAAGPVRREGT